MRLVLVTGVGIAAIIAATAGLLWWARASTPPLPSEPVVVAPGPLPGPPKLVEPTLPPARPASPVPVPAEPERPAVAAAPQEPDAGDDGDPLVLDDERPAEDVKSYPPATAQTIAHELKTHAEALRSCYAAWPQPPFSSMRDLSVKLMVRRPAGSGAVRIEDVRALADSPGRVAFEACARRALAGVRFSKALPEKEITLYLPQ